MYLEQCDFEKIEYDNADEYELKEMFREYFPIFSKSEDIVKYIKPKMLYVDASKENTFVLSFRGEWEEEHEMYIAFENNKVIYKEYDYKLLLYKLK